MTHYLDQQSQSGTLLDSDGKHIAGEKRKMSTYMFALRLKFLQVLSQKDRFARLGWASDEHEV